MHGPFCAIVSALLLLSACSADHGSTGERAGHVADHDAAARQPSKARPAWGTEPSGAMRVTSMSLEAQRTAGDANIVPDEATRRTLSQSGKQRAITPVKLCVSELGTVVYVQILKSFGAPDYDETIETTLRSTWRFRSLLVNGDPVPACTDFVLSADLRPRREIK